MVLLPVNLTCLGFPVFCSSKTVCSASARSAGITTIYDSRTSILRLRSMWRGFRLTERNLLLQARVAESRSFWICDPSPRLRTCFLFWIIRHRITLSALAKTFGGIVIPICLAVFKLITSSNLVGCSTGRSAGLAPLRILST